MTNTYQTEVILGNGYEVGVEIYVEEYEPSYPATWGRLPEDSDPGSQGYVALGTIRTYEAVEELGLKEGQEIDPAFLLGGAKALRKLEEEALDERENGYGAYDGPDEPDYDDYYEPGY